MAENASKVPELPSTLQSPASHHTSQKERAASPEIDASNAPSLPPPPTNHDTPQEESAPPPKTNLIFKVEKNFNYAKPFALAILRAYADGTLSGPGTNAQRDTKLAERVLAGEGGYLAFSSRWIRRAGEIAIFNATAAKYREGAFIHIFGEASGECEEGGCHSGPCSYCDNGRGTLRGCRHTHGLIARWDIACSNCVLALTSERTPCPGGHTPGGSKQMHGKLDMFDVRI